MIRSHLQIAGPLLLGTLTGIVLVTRVHAGPERVAFPENYDQGVKWLVIDRLDSKELQEYFVTRARCWPLERARKCQTGRCLRWYASARSWMPTAILGAEPTGIF
jgi:hypothetical protein